LKYTVSESRKIYVQGRIEGELFISQEFDDSVTLHDVGFKQVVDRLEEWVQEERGRLMPPPTPTPAPAGTVPETTSPFTGEPIPKPEPAPKPALEVTAIKDVSNAFPPDLAGLLYFEMTENYVIAKPRQYLGSDNFRSIAAVVREQLGGEYVSEGKESHFRIPRSKSAEPSKTIGFIDEKPSKSEQPEKVPEFDPEVLMQWTDWKRKKKPDGTYEAGSKEYGWDFADRFPEAVIKVLEKGPQTIAEHEFSLSGKFVKARKKGEPRRR
jgi:hypothetical protein